MDSRDGMWVYGGVPKLGVLGWGLPHTEDHYILVSILGSPYLRETNIYVYVHYRDSSPARNSGKLPHSAQSERQVQS